MTTPTTTVTIDCPNEREGWACDGEVTVLVTGRYRPARGFDPAECPEYEIVKQTCDCPPLVIDGLAGFDRRMTEALAEVGA